MSAGRPVPLRARLRRRARRSLCWIAGAAGLVASCAEENPPRPPASLEAPGWRVVHRLVDPETREGAVVEPSDLKLRGRSPAGSEPPTARPAHAQDVSELPVATIEGDTRPVLAAHESHRLSKRGPFAPDEPAAFPLEGLFAGARSLVVEPTRVMGRERLVPGPAKLRRVVGVWRRRRVLLPPEAVVLGSATPTRVSLAVVRPPAQSLTRYTAPALPIPDDARLEFAFGVLEPAAAQGPVRFSIDACSVASCESVFEETIDPRDVDGGGWQERRLSLSSLAGTEPALRFTTVYEGTGGFTLPVWGDPVVLAPSSERNPHSGIILLSIDTLRRDHLDLYGYARETARFLRTRLAPRGTVFEQLIAEAATTDPSHMTMFTSLPAQVHRVAGQQTPLRFRVQTLAEALRSHGYRTAAFTENGPLSHERGFSIGFDRWVENKSRHVLLPEGHIEQTFGQARDWLDRNADLPFFLFLHTFQVHAPYSPPARHLDPLGVTAEPGSVEEDVAQYDAEIRYTDAELSRLYAWLEQSGRNEDTIWVVLSDHGEEFQEHGSTGHMSLPYEELLRVPLIVAGPGIAAGRRESTPVHHLDLMPTLLELAGAPVPPTTSGRSFAGLLAGDGGASELPDRPLFSAAWSLPGNFEPPALAVRDGGWKLIRYLEAGESRTKLYDLRADPREQNDLSDEEAAVRDRLSQLLDDREGAMAERRAALLGGKEPTEEEEVPLDPQREQMLRTLGYIE